MYKIIGKIALLSFFVLTFNTLEAQKFVRGILTDYESKEPIIGASVIEKGTYNGTTTDVFGKFELPVQSYPVIIQLSYLGYESKEIEVKDDKVINFTLTQTVALLNEIVVSSRRRKEEAQNIPIPITVLGSAQIDNTVSFNVNRVKELVPSVQLYSSNPRNTTLNIRGLGSTYGLTNDGLDPGVGFYVDGVYFNRPAVTAIDFIDIEQIEVLRGPQGTLFGKNTTAGAFNVTTRKPTFTTTANFELSYGNFNFVQGRGSISGPIIKDKLAARVSFSGTHRNGILNNVATGRKENTINNLGVRGQLLYKPNSDIDITFSGDVTQQRPTGYAQVFAGVAPTLRADYRQFENIIADLDYDLPSRNPFDRVIDHDTPWKSDNDLGGAALNADFKLGPGTLTSTTAWRYWNWGPSNDRDFTGLEGLKKSQAPSRHDQWSQEVRYSGDFAKKLSGVAGLFLLWQDLHSAPFHTEEAGKDQWRFSQNTTSELWKTPGLLDGYGIKTYNQLNTFTAALFGQLDYKVIEKLSILAGVRVNYDKKEIDYRRETYGGLETDDPALLALKRAVYNDQAFNTSTKDINFSGQLTVAYRPTKKINAFATYSNSYKPVGVNLGGLPNSGGEPMIELAVIKPELVHQYELGLKTTPKRGYTANLTLFNSTIKNYQTLVQTADLSVNRGYLANAEKVRVRGIEFEASAKFNKFFSLYGSVNVTDGKYLSFTNAPPPLEETGGPTFKDISGSSLPGISTWAATAGGELTLGGNLFGQKGNFFLGFDVFYRSEFSSSPTPSKYLTIDPYTLLNARLGFRANEGLTFFVWSRNLTDKNYFEQLLPGGGNIGHYAGVLGEQRTFGATLRYTLY